MQEELVKTDNVTTSELEAVKEEIKNRDNIVDHKKRFIQYIFITLGVLILDIAFYFFLDPARIVSGGAMGLSILFTPLIHSKLEWFTNSTFLYIVDGIALLMGLLFLGKDLSASFNTRTQPLIASIRASSCLIRASDTPI